MIEGKLREILGELDIHPGRAGRKGWMTAPCPFAEHTHASGRDKNPGFGAKIEANGFSSFYCLTCKKHGTIPDLVEQMERMFKTSYGNLHVRALLAEADGTLEPWDNGSAVQLPEEPKALVESIFAGMYPLAGEVPHALEYLQRRGISKRTAEKAGLKFDPREQRIIVPIYDRQKSLFGFNGRTILPEEQWPDNGPNRAPYKKTKDYSGLVKSHQVMGIHLAKPGKPFFVVEGLFAYLHLLEIGADEHVNVVATLGASLSEKQRDKIVEFGTGVYMCYDNDSAGDAGLYGPLDEEGRHEGGGAIDKLKKYVPTFIPYFPNGVDDPDDLTLPQVMDMISFSFVMA